MVLKKVKIVRVYLWDNDITQQEYNVGKYAVKGMIIPERMYDDILNESRRHDVYFPFSDVIECFINTMLYGNGQAISTNFNVFLQMESLPIFVKNVYKD